MLVVAGNDSSSKEDLAKKREEKGQQQQDSTDWWYDTNLENFGVKQLTAFVRANVWSYPTNPEEEQT